MKIHFLVPMLLLFNVVCSQQVELLNEDFNNGFPTNWTHYYSDWGGEKFAIDSGALRENSGPYFEPVSNWIYFPTVDLTSVSAPYLEFDFAMAVMNKNIRFSVFYTTDSIWDPLLTVDDTSTAITIHTIITLDWRPGTYQKISVDLAQFKHETNMKLAFVFDYLNPWAAGVWYIDNVRIFDNAQTGIMKQAAPLSFQMFPNPANNSIQIIPGNAVKHGSLKITGMRGELLLEQNVGPNGTIIDLSNFSAGVYSVQYTHINETFAKTLIVR